MQLTKYFPDEQSPFHHQEDSLLPHHHHELIKISENSDDLATLSVTQAQQKFSTASEMRFYNEHKRLFTVSYHLWIQGQRQRQLWETLSRRIKTMEDRLRDCKIECAQSEESRAKRSRRTAEMIEKKYKCKAPLCEKSYGAEGSLQQHIKIKHPELYTRGEDEQQLEGMEGISESIFSLDL